MSEISFWRDPVFWITFGILQSYWIVGFTAAADNYMASAYQMKNNRVRRGLPWSGHGGFWYLFFVLHATLSYATAKMWPLWQNRGGLIALSIIVGGAIGYKLQTAWSEAAGSSDAWSRDGRPNSAGIIHILHMGPEVGIMLMLCVSMLWYKEIPAGWFVGLLLIVLNHFLIGITHWPLHWMYPSWRPASMKYPLTLAQRIMYAFATCVLMGGGFYLIALS